MEEFEILLVYGLVLAQGNCCGLTAADEVHPAPGLAVGTLVMHSEDDQIVPYVAAGPLSYKLLENGAMKTYRGFPHGMPMTEAGTINSDLLAFIKT